jgi:hypothetical protein
MLRALGSCVRRRAARPLSAPRPRSTTAPALPAPARRPLRWEDDGWREAARHGIVEGCLHIDQDALNDAALGSLTGQLLSRRAVYDCQSAVAKQNRTSARYRRAAGKAAAAGALSRSGAGARLAGPAPPPPGRASLAERRALTAQAPLRGQGGLLGSHARARRSCARRRTSSETPTHINPAPNLVRAAWRRSSARQSCPT